MPGEVAGGPQESGGDIAGEARRFPVEGGYVFSQLTVVVVHGEEGIGQGPGGGGRDAVVVESAGGGGGRELGYGRNGARIGGMLVGGEGEGGEEGPVPVGRDLAHEEGEGGKEGCPGRGEAAFEGGAGTFLSIGHAAFAAQGGVGEAEEELGLGADEDVQVGGEVLGAFEGLEAVGDEVFGEGEGGGETGMEGEARPAEAVQAVLDGGRGAREMAGDGGEGFAFGDGAEDLGEVQGALGVVVQGEGGSGEGRMAGGAAEPRDEAVPDCVEGPEPAEERTRRVRGSVMMVVEAGGIGAEGGSERSIHVSRTCTRRAHASGECDVRSLFSLPVHNILR